MKRIAQLLLILSIALGSVAISLVASAQIPPPEDPEGMLSDAYTGKSYSPYAGRGFATFPLWGDSHLHTGNSFDAGAFGAREEFGPEFGFHHRKRPRSYPPENHAHAARKI